MKKAANCSMPSKSDRTNRKPVPWWSEEIAALRRACLKSRRIFQRLAKKRGISNSEEQKQPSERAGAISC